MFAFYVGNEEVDIVHTCKFCGEEIPEGKGFMFVKRDGEILYFCSSKCYRNYAIRNPRKVKWTKAYGEDKELRLKSSK